MLYYLFSIHKILSSILGIAKQIKVIQSWTAKMSQRVKLTCPNHMAHGRKRELIVKRCLLISTHLSWSVHEHMQMH